ncbi:MAG: cytochrome c biogenesis protein ResB [Alistipes sp.]|nr:cytochrome c biogenesis protein ResB [Alistipes sp.]
MKIYISGYTLTTLLLVLFTVVAALLLESVAGSVALDIFAFPMNLILMLLWLTLLVELYRDRAKSVVARYLLSTQATIFSLVALAVGTIVMGLQTEPATTSYLFLALIFFALSQLTMVIFRGWRDKSGVRWLFTASHLGLWLALVAGFWGAPDCKVMRVAVSEEPTNRAIYINGMVTSLDYNIALESFKIDYFDNGTPSLYQADVNIDGKSVVLAVNHPYSPAFGEDIYLTSFEQEGQSVVAILQIVRQPWKWVMFSGILLLIVGAVLMFLRGPRR